MTLAVLATTLLGAPPAAASTDGFASILQPYEAVRQALVADDLAAARAPTAELAEALGRLRHQATAPTAGVPAEKLEEVRAFLPEMASATAELAAANDLAAAREAFYALSKPLVRWRQAAGEGPAVVYCPMKERSWLQPAGEAIGNPFNGQKMASCGQVVAR
jgi:hypothetical protein